MKKQRLSPEVRTEMILDVAVGLAARHGIYAVTRNQIAAEAKVTPGLVTFRLGTMDAMRRSVMRRAIAKEILPVIVQGLLAKDPYAKRAPEDLRRRALESLMPMLPGGQAPAAAPAPEVKAAAPVVKAKAPAAARRVKPADPFAGLVRGAKA